MTYTPAEWAAMTEAERERAEYWAEREFLRMMRDDPTDDEGLFAQERAALTPSPIRTITEG